MKAMAVVFTRANTVEFQEVNCPDPAPGDVVLRLTHSWISNGTEGSYCAASASPATAPGGPAIRFRFPSWRATRRSGSWNGSAAR